MERAIADPKVFVIDTSYESGLDDTQYRIRNEAERIKLERLTGLVSTHADIGSGADWPAFCLTIPGFAVIAGAAALFFQGKRVEENLDSWRRLGAKLNSAFRRPSRYNRTGFILAALEIAAKGEVIQTFELHGYRARDRLFPSSSDAELGNGRFDEEPSVAFLGRTMHVAVFSINDRRYRAFTHADGEVNCESESV